MSVTRVRVRRERPTALALAVALCVTMLVVYVLTLNVGGPDVVESMAAAPRVTREICFEALDGWCVTMGERDTQEEARLLAAGYVSRGAAGYVAELDGKWTVLGALYDGERDARRIAERLREDEGLPAQAVRLGAPELTLRITAPESQIDAVAGADALLRRQTAQLGQMALQLDREEIRAESARALCALAATEAAEAGAALRAVPGAEDNALCKALIDRLSALSELQKAAADSASAGSATLSGMLRCAQLETFLGQRALIRRMKGA